MERLETLLPSSRPDWANMPPVAATHFTNLLLFVCAALDHLGVEHVIHYGSLLGAARLGSPLPWDEDHDLFVVDTDLTELRARLQPLLEAHGYRVVPDRRGFLWIKDRYWAAGSGHLALDVLPPTMDRVADLPVWEGGAPHMIHGELRPLRPLPFCGSFVWAPAAVEPILVRLYGPSGSVETMSRFSAPRIDPDTAAFWAAARPAGQLDWPAISRRFQSRSRWRHLLAVPWWWFNGGYIVGIDLLKKWARRWRER
ncbi:MAG TPA: LicD family protein [Reyranella sp.]|nr:LicD family protein [Reyranella sp.]